MNFEVTVSNYRCFSDTPVRFALREGLQSFVGVNNSGKSCLLRLFYELRQLFSQFSDMGALFAALTATHNYHQMPLVKDADEIFNDRNTRDLVIGFEMEGGSIDGAAIPSRFEVALRRGSTTWSARVYAADGTLVANPGLNIAGNAVLFQHGPDTNRAIGPLPLSSSSVHCSCARFT